MWGKKQGEVCYKDNDCESGFLCVEESGLRSCQAPVPGEKGLGKFLNAFYKPRSSLNMQ